MPYASFLAKGLTSVLSVPATLPYIECPFVLIEDFH